MHQFRKAFELFAARNDKWGDAWREYTVDGLISHARAKAQRAMIANRKLDAKEDIIDSLLDCINYCGFALIKLDELEEHKIE